MYVALVCAPLLLLLAGPMPPGAGLWWDLSMALGFAGVAIMGVQFALTARFRGASAPFGIERGNRGAKVYCGGPVRWKVMSP